ncbi:hypothetical protein [Kitasatospora phosalacinea]|uniref:Uncharacterized protein n=1 Tax=Kitasatospora phosalacinea TaxID=2065 RepID=A0ABW6GNF0_9ACTN
MARLTEEDKARNEAAIRTAMERLLSGDLPPGGKCDLKTLALMAGVTRTGFYPKKARDGSERPGTYQHLANEFERRLRARQDAGEVTDPRVAQIERLKAENAQLRSRVADRDTRLAELTAFREMAISRLAAQHDEIEQLRRQAASTGNVRHLTHTGRLPSALADDSA